VFEFNVALNGVKEKVECFNLDAREFITKVFQEGGCDYIVMNLSAIAIEFLDVIGQCTLRFREVARLPVVHFHSFDAKDLDHKVSLKQRAQDALAMDLPRLTVHKVRDVAPGKDMFRCSFSVLDLLGDGEPGARVAPV
jgi:tRNA G37 N-methylase Trm5